MTVQIKPSRPKDQHNGLADIEAELLAHPDAKVTAIVTFSVDKRVEDLSKSPVENYPVLGMKHIEPIRGELEQEAIDLQVRAYKARTGENELDFDTLIDVEDDDTEGGDQ